MEKDKLGRFKKGFTPWIKGRKGIHNSPATEFKKGIIPWNKGNKFPEFSGENHPLWKGGRYKTTNGYILGYAFNHPRAYKNRIYEHILVAERKLGRYLLPNEIIHHLNGIKDDNRPENIIVCKSDKEHLKNHRLNRWSRKFDNCRRCKTIKIRHEARGLCNNCYKLVQYHKKLCEY